MAVALEKTRRKLSGSLPFQELPIPPVTYARIVPVVKEAFIAIETMRSAYDHLGVPFASTRHKMRHRHVKKPEDKNGRFIHLFDFEGHHIKSINLINCLTKPLSETDFTILNHNTSVLKEGVLAMINPVQWRFFPPDKEDQHIIRQLPLKRVFFHKNHLYEIHHNHTFTRMTIAMNSPECLLSNFQNTCECDLGYHFLFQDRVVSFAKNTLTQDVWPVTIQYPENERLYFYCSEFYLIQGKNYIKIITRRGRIISKKDVLFYCRIKGNKMYYQLGNEFFSFDALTGIESYLFSLDHYMRGFDEYNGKILYGEREKNILHIWDRGEFFTIALPRTNPVGVRCVKFVDEGRKALVTLPQGKAYLATLKS